MGREARVKEVRGVTRHEMQPFVDAVAHVLHDRTEVLRRGLLGRLKWLLLGK